MNIMIWIVAGAAAGWIACRMLHLNLTRGVVLSAIIGAAGAVVGGHLLAPIFGATVAETDAFSPFALIVAIATAAGCLSISDMMYERFGF